MGSGSRPRENEGGRADYSAHDAMFAQHDTSRNSPASPVAVAGIGSGTAAPDDRTLIPATTAAATSRVCPWVLTRAWPMRRFSGSVSVISYGKRNPLIDKGQ